VSTDRVEARFRRSPLLLGTWCDDHLELLDADTLRRWPMTGALVELLAALGSWSTADELARAGMPIGTQGLTKLVELGLVESDACGTEGASRGGVWDPLELAVHRRTAFGGVRPAASGSPSPRRERPAPSAIELPLPATPLNASLGDVLTSRRTLRAYAARALRLEELSSFLHHAAQSVEADLRPYPTAGARSELEVYVVANDVDGLQPGAYHYDPHCHRLTRLRGRDAHQAQLVEAMHAATGGSLSGDPPVILLITAVFERIMARYRQLGLSLIYKDVGGLFQTFYLVATAMGLAPCAIGGGQERANSLWLGLDPLVESQVGCFLLGAAERSEPSLARDE
jgi:SagB-type dehydrogenase family enzyme